MRNLAHFARRWSIPALLLLCLLLLFTWLGRPLVVREQELRVVLTARDMARGGSWLVPTYHGEPRLNKPPLMYWITATAFRIAHTTLSPAVARLTSAVSGAGLALIIYLFGRRLIGRRRALLGALAAATSYVLIRSARLCETDVPLALFTSCAAFCAYRGVVTRRRGWWPLAGVAAGLGFLIKGPAALVLPAAAVAAFALWPPRPKPRTYLAPGLCALALAALIALPWYLYILRMAPANAVRGDIGYELGALVTRSAHEGPIYFYLYTLLYTFLPWSPLLPIAAIAAWPAARRHAGVRFLLAWLLSAVLIMSLVKSKQQHYATLVVAPAALLLGILLHRGFSGRPGWLTRTIRGYAALVGALTLVGGVALALLPRFIGPLSATACVLLGALTAAAGLLPWLAARPRRFPARLAGVTAAVVLLTWAYVTQIQELLEPSRMFRQFAAEVQRQRGARARVFMAGHNRNAMQYSLDTPITPVGSFNEGWKLAKPGDLLILYANHRNRVIAEPFSVPPALSAAQNGFRLVLFKKQSEAAGPGRPSE